MTISAEDRFEIQDVIIQLYQALDRHRGSEYASFFVPDGCLENKSFVEPTPRTKVTRIQAGSWD